MELDFVVDRITTHNRTVFYHREKTKHGTPAQFGTFDGAVSDSTYSTPIRSPDWPKLHRNPCCRDTMSVHRVLSTFLRRRTLFCQRIVTVTIMVICCYPGNMFEYTECRCAIVKFQSKIVHGIIHRSKFPVIYSAQNITINNYIPPFCVIEFFTGVNTKSPHPLP